MRLDVISIFPDYLAPLDLSLIGKARQTGLLDLHVHDLRAFTHDRHNTVDDTPYGGGAGMVMKPEPWGEALDHVVAQGDSRPILIVPGPGGQRFDLFVFGDVGFDADDFGAVGGKFGDGFVELAGIDISQHQLHAFGGSRYGDGFTDAFGTTSDNGNFAFEVLHLISPKKFVVFIEWRKPRPARR